MSLDFKKARQTTGYSVEEVSEILKIRKQYIIGIEEGNLDVIPGEVYVRGYKKIYAEFLGLELTDQINVKVAPAAPKPILNNSMPKIYVLLAALLLLVLLVVVYLTHYTQESASTQTNSSIINLDDTSFYDSNDPQNVTDED